VKITERAKALIAAVLIALACGLLLGGPTALFLTRLASMRVGGAITAASFLIIVLAQWAYDGRD